MPARDFLLERMEQYLRTRLSQDSYTREKPFRPALTVSRECGAGMDQIGRALVDYLSEVDDSTDLGWALFDQRMIGKIIEDNNLPRSVTPFLLEDSKFPVLEAFEQILNLPPSEWALFNYSADTIRNLCRLGNCIIVGRAGNFVTADLENTFHVRLVGALPKRIQYTAARHDISTARATNLVNETDSSRKSFVARHAQAQIESPTSYHLVLNTDDIPPDIAARIVADSLLEWAHQKDQQRRSIGQDSAA